MHPVFAGAYAVGHRVLSQHGRWMAAVLAAGQGAVLSHRSAAALWGIRPTSRAHVEVTAAHGSAPAESILTRRSPAGRDDDVPRHPRHDRAQDPPRPRRRPETERARPGAQRSGDPRGSRAHKPCSSATRAKGHHHPPNPPPQCPPFAPKPHGGRVPRLHQRPRPSRAGDQRHHRGLRVRRRLARRAPHRRTRRLRDPWDAAGVRAGPREGPEAGRKRLADDARDQTGSSRPPSSPRSSYPHYAHDQHQPVQERQPHRRRGDRSSRSSSSSTSSPARAARSCARSCAAPPTAP